MQPPNVGARIKEARQGAGLSQIALADLLGAGERTVQAWERNERTPRMGALLQLATVLEREPSWFYSEPEGAAA